MVATHKKFGSASLVTAVAVGAGAFILLQMIAYGVQTSQDPPGLIESFTAPYKKAMSAAERSGDDGDGGGGDLFANEFFRSPFLVDRHLLSLKKEMDEKRDRLLRRFSPALRGDTEAVKEKVMSPPVFDVVEDDERVTVSVGVPDVPLEDMTVEVIDDVVLHISGGKKTHEEGYVSGIRFDLNFALGTGIDQDKITAHLKDGTLTITGQKKVRKEKDNRVRNIAIEEK